MSRREQRYPYVPSMHATHAHTHSMRLTTSAHLPHRNQVLTAFWLRSCSHHVCSDKIPRIMRHACPATRLHGHQGSAAGPESGLAKPTKPILHEISRRVKKESPRGILGWSSQRRPWLLALRLGQLGMCRRLCLSLLPSPCAVHVACYWPLPMPSPSRSDNTRACVCREEDPGASGRRLGSVIRGRWPRCIYSLTHSPSRIVWVMATSAALLCCALVALSSLDGSHSGTVLTYSGRVVNVRDIAAQTKEQLLLNEAGDHYSWNDQQKVIDARKNQKVIITASCMLYLCWSMSQKLMPRIAHNQNSVGGLAQLPPVRVPQRWTLLPLRRPRKLCVQPVLRRFRRHLQRRGQHWVQWSEHVEQRA